MFAWLECHGDRSNGTRRLPRRWTHEPEFRSDPAPSPPSWGRFSGFKAPMQKLAVLFEGGLFLANNKVVSVILATYLAGMLQRVSRTKAAPGFIEPCLPTRKPYPPAGGGWPHEIKHDGYRLQIHRSGGFVRLLTRRGLDWTERYPLVANAARSLRAESFVFDGEVVVCGEDGVASFSALRRRGASQVAFVYAFDLLMLAGQDIRKQPIEDRKSALAILRHKASPGLQLSEHIADIDGRTMFAHACKMGLEGIVSKRLGSKYQSGRSPHWVKAINPAAPAVKRLEEEDW
jgi:bifunctional non-homologous end joining protein LigD